MVHSPPEVAQLDQLLNFICVGLQPTPTQYRDADHKYMAVGGWLSAPGSELLRFLPEIFAQGSFRIGTVVRPWARLEFDVDLVCQLQIDYGKVLPMEVYGLIEARLRANEIYRDLLEPKNRCLRLNYAGQFHLDILPACPNPLKGGTAIVVPDREARCWKTSNPKGYGAWFGQRATLSIAEAKALEPLPAPETAEAKTPLQQAVQLIKRERDVAFGTSDAAPRSIVLTTLAAQFYQGERSVADTMTHYLDRLLALVGHNAEPPIVRNPTDNQEILSEKWQSDPSSYDVFVQETRRFARLWSQIRTARGLQEIAAGLKALFGEDLVAGAMKQYAESLGLVNQAGGIRTAVRSPLIISSPSVGRPIEPPRVW